MESKKKIVERYWKKIGVESDVDGVTGEGKKRNMARTRIEKLEQKINIMKNRNELIGGKETTTYTKKWKQ